MIMSNIILIQKYAIGLAKIWIVNDAALAAVVLATNNEDDIISRKSNDGLNASATGQNNLAKYSPFTDLHNCMLQQFEIICNFGCPP